MGNRFGAVVAICAGLLAALPTAASAKTFNFAFEADVVSMDPQSTRLIFTTSFLANIYEPLVRFNRQNEIEPALAERWENNSPTLWRFYLRKGVTFHNGDPFTADDFIFSVQRAQNEKSPYRGMVSGLRTVTKIDDHTIDIDTGVPNPVLLRELPAVLVMNKKWTVANGGADPIDPVAGKESQLARNAVGTGPFVLKSYTPGTRMELEPNDKWWDRARQEHNLTKVVFRPIKADSTRVAALLSGELDMIFPAPVQDIERIRGTSGFKVMVRPSVRTLQLGFDTRNPELANSNVKGKNPFKDIRVRQAVYQAIDEDAIVQKVMRGMATPASAIVAPGINGYDKRLEGRLKYDPAAAKALLTQAGYPNGFSFDLDCSSDRYVNDEQICLAVATMLAKIDLTVKVNARTTAQHFSTILKGQSPMFLNAWGADFNLDSGSFLRDIMHTPDGGRKGTWNPGGYSNARVDEIEELAAKEMDPDKRRALIYEAFKIHKDEIGHIPMHQEEVVWAMKSNVTVEQTPINVLWLRWVKVN